MRSSFVSSFAVGASAGSAVSLGQIPLIMTPNGPHNLLPTFSYLIHGGEAVQHVEADKTPPDVDPEFGAWDGSERHSNCTI